MIVVDEEPIEFVVKSFYGTHVMNVADWKAAYCLFPRLTLEEQLMFLFHIKRCPELMGLDKYLDRGFGLPADFGTTRMKSEELLAVRKVGDSLCRKLCFSGVQLEAKERELYPEKCWMEDIQFRFDGRRMIVVKSE